MTLPNKAFNERGTVTENGKRTGEQNHQLHALFARLFEHCSCRAPARTLQLPAPVVLVSWNARGKFCTE